MENLTLPENQNYSLNIPQKNIYKILFFIFLGLFLIISSVLVTLLFTQKNPEISENMATKELKTIPTEIPISDVTKTPSISTTKLNATPTSYSMPKEWKTYTDSTYKFSIDYPSDWVFMKVNDYFTITSAERNKDVETNGPTTTNGPEINIMIYDSFSKLPEYDIAYEGKTYSSNQAKNLEEYVSNDLFDVKKILINGTGGYSGYSGYPDHRIFLQKGNLIINIIEGYSYDHSVYESNQNNKMNIIKKIIESFKFN